MNNLLDTHVLIWFINGGEELSEKAIKSIENRNANNFISIASLWEIAIKLNLKKLELQTPFSALKQKIEENGFQILPITFEDTLIISTLPLYHRDPFDRIIITQGITNKLTVISKDKHFSDYGVDLLW